MAKRKSSTNPPNPHRPDFEVTRGADGRVVLLNPPANLDYADQLLGGWSTWFTKARNLLYTASLLEPSILEWRRARTEAAKRTSTIPIAGVYGSYFMLIAYAIENLCKGYILRARSEETRETIATQVRKGEVVRLPPWLKTHELLPLTRSVGLTPSLGEADLLRRLTFNSVWFARYPIPTDSERLDESFPPFKTLLVEFRDPSATEIVMESGLLSYYYDNDLERVRLLLAKITDLTGREGQPTLSVLHPTVSRS